MKRFFDILLSFIGLIILFPVLTVIWLSVLLDSKGGGFYKQVRVGKDGIDFHLFKFRTMRTGADKTGLLTIGGRDSRITRTGYYLRKYKLDELPQLLNVLIGDMSLVGPRPEVRKYVEHYSAEQLQVLRVRPGITDYASIAYVNESDLLAKSTNPEQTYLEVIMPAKLALNRRYIDEKSAFKDVKIILQTLFRIMRA
jgi:lipopolysaccharide/colanic/teichoic acid biosynthesis glycosyltransferase